MSRFTRPGRAIALALGLALSTPVAGTAQEIAGAGPEHMEDSAITYHGRVAGILREHCVACHNENGIAPFPLTTYEETRRRIGRIRRAIEGRRMPPWFANPEYGVWRNDRRLPESDRRDLLAWIEADAPEGSGPSTSPGTAVARHAAGEDPSGGWMLGRAPDTVVVLPEVMEIPAEGVIPYQYLFVKTEYAEDRWLEALELRPTAREVVHHTAAFLQGPDDVQRGPYLTLWTGRTQPTVYPEGVAKRLPAGAWIMFEVHYSPNGDPTTDRTELGLVFADAPPEREASTLAVATREFIIPPHVDDHPVIAELPFWRGGEILSLLPHMHRRGTAFRYELERPDGSVEVLLDVPRYDFRWQLSYEFATPLRVEAGDTLRAWAWYDNSAGNPHNPDPDAIVRHGPQDFEEMMAGFFEWVGDPVDVNVGAPLILVPDTIPRRR